MNENLFTMAERIDANLSQIHFLCEQCSDSLQKLLDLLEHSPKIKIPGHLVKTSEDGFARWRRVLDPEESKSGKKECIYLGVSNVKTCELLAWKLYRDHSLRIRTEQLKAVQTFLQKNNQVEKHRCRAIHDPDLLKILGHEHTLSEKLQEWQNSDYPHNPNHPEGLRIHADGNMLVRSKSEALIVSALIQLHIPFRYECGLSLRGTVIYPDFTICHPQTGKTFLWEHFGMMDDNNYAANAARKIDAYIQSGYFPMKNLILTYETKDHPLDYRYVKATAEHFFGNT